MDNITCINNVLTYLVATGVNVNIKMEGVVRWGVLVCGAGNRFYLKGDAREWSASEVAALTIRPNTVKIELGD